MGLALADLIVARLLPVGSPITIAVDDTSFKRSGKSVFGAAWHHDGAAKGPKPIGFAQLLGRGRRRGAAVVSVPSGVPAGAGSAVATPAHREDGARPRAGRVDRRTLPGPHRACGRGRRLRGRTPPHPGRPDHLDQPTEARLGIAPAAPPRTIRSGRPRSRGARLGTPTDLAASVTAEARWRATRVRRYGRTDTVHTARFAAEPCGSFWFATMSLRLAAVTIAVMGLPLVTTDLESAAEDVVARYASRFGLSRPSPALARS